MLKFPNALGPAFKNNERSVQNFIGIGLISIESNYNLKLKTIIQPKTANRKGNPELRI